MKNKQLIFKCLLILVMSLTGSKMMAGENDLEWSDYMGDYPGTFTYIDGILYFHPDDTMDEVEAISSEQGSNYVINAVIPDYITYNGIQFHVTNITCWFFDSEHLESISIPQFAQIVSPPLYYEGYNRNLTSIVVDAGNFYYDSRDSCNAVIDKWKNELVLGCSTTTIPGGITTIGECAFNGCIGLTSITIPSSVTRIEKNAFSRCASLADVYCYAENVPDTNYGVFDYTNISSATLHVPAASLEAYRTTAPWKEFGTIVAIDDSPIIEFADANVKALCVTNWDSNGDDELSEAEAAAVTDLGTVFKNNTQISSFDELQYFTGLTSIGYAAFYGCSGLTSITIPEGVTSIGEKVFYDCSSLTSIIISTSVTSIGANAFSNCNSLTDFYCFAENIPSTIYGVPPYSDMHYNTFHNTLTSSATLHVPEVSLESYSTTAPWKYFGTIVAIDNTPIIDFADAYVKAICIANWDTSGDGELSEAEAAAVTDLGTVFKNNIQIGSFDELQYFTGVTNIGEEAFYQCYSLASIIIPEGVTSIGSQAFYECHNLQSFTIPEGVTTISDFAFYHCYRLTSVTIPEGVTTISDYTFYWCRGLTSVTIPNSVTSIGERAFALCEGLTSITIPNSVTSIGIFAFKDCSSLTSVNIPSGVTCINYSAFSGCSSLPSITIPENVTSIYGGAFSFCSSLTSIYIPSSVTSIRTTAFSSCRSLTSIVVEPGNSKYDSRNNCNAIIETATNTLIQGCQTTIIPSSVTCIGNSAFSGCRDMTSVTIPNSVTSIGVNAFSDCSTLTSVTIPNSVTSIGDGTFSGCTGLTSITIPNSVTDIGYMAFDGCI